MTPSLHIDAHRGRKAPGFYGICGAAGTGKTGGAELERPLHLLPVMSLCASCGLQLTGDAGLCPHHHCVYGDDWAVANRIMCDFFHRKKVPPRLSQSERDDDFWAHTGEAA
jgi:hypothetical protein